MKGLRRPRMLCREGKAPNAGTLQRLCGELWTPCEPPASRVGLHRSHKFLFGGLFMGPRQKKKQEKTLKPIPELKNPKAPLNCTCSCLHCRF